MKDNESFYFDPDKIWFSTDEESNCTVQKKEYSNFANSFKNEIEDLWYPKGGIYTSTEACYNENRNVNGKFVNGKMIFPMMLIIVVGLSVILNFDFKIFILLLNVFQTLEMRNILKVLG